MRSVLFLLTLFTWSAHSKVVLVDPGHGGAEFGAVGYLDSKKTMKVYEKDLALRLSKRIKEELSKKTTTYLTRSVDRTVTLQERADLADMVKADLLLSIHFNSTTNPKSHGFELYYLDNNSNAAANKVERAENLNLKGEELIVNQILVDLVVQQTVSHSKKLAHAVLDKIKPVIRNNKIDNRGIKPGLFYVLALSKRPGLLVEVGFMSNPAELRKMNDEKFLAEMARSISDGVMTYISTK